MTTPYEPWNAASVLMAVTGCAFLAAAGWTAWSTATFLSRAIHVPGAISDPQSHPRIRFTTLDGTAVEFRGHGTAAGALGDAVPVAYLPEDPEGTAQADTFWSNWIETLGFLWIGLGLTLLPTFGARAEFRTGRW